MSQYSIVCQFGYFLDIKSQIYDKIFHSENFINLVISILGNLPHMDIITNIKKLGH